MMLAQMIGIIGPIDMEMLELGQETQKYFTDDYDLFTKNEVRFFFHTCSPAYLPMVTLNEYPLITKSILHELLLLFPSPS